MNLSNYLPSKINTDFFLINGILNTNKRLFDEASQRWKRLENSNYHKWFIKMYNQNRNLTFKLRQDRNPEYEKAVKKMLTTFLKSRLVKYQDKVIIGTMLLEDTFTLPDQLK